jgi:phosphatidylserine/phosphatidylglycerophosphate/cardiolipin synthase-like enzyme
MYDPSISDNYYEWVELYNPTNKSINLSGWSLTDNSERDFLLENFENKSKTWILLPFSYAIITDHGTKIYNHNYTSIDSIKLLIDDSAIGNGLGNSGDKLILKNKENETIDSVEWIKNHTDVPGFPTFAVEENCTLSRMNSFDKNDSRKDFFKSITPTPGYKNNITKIGETKITCNESYFLIDKYENLNIQIFVKNTGWFSDNITITKKLLSDGWNALIENKKINLEPNETRLINISVTACKKNCYKTGQISFIASSEHKKNVSEKIILTFEIDAPDLFIKKIKGYNESGNETSEFFEGEIIKIKSFLKNQGRKNAEDVFVHFYLDEIDEKNFLGYKYYDYIGKYQKYPSIKIDTSGFSPGKHYIIVIPDMKNIVDEFNEKNNKKTYRIEIKDTSPSKFAKKLVINELYYHSRPGLFNEFITIFNPTNQSINISGWYITNEPLKIKSKQNKIIFPKNTQISKKSKLILTENAYNFNFETGKTADFEYNYDTDQKIPQMISEKKFIMSNIGKAISLKDCFNHTIDFLIYGNNTIFRNFWNGPSIPLYKEGIVLKRNFDEAGLPIDTNSSFDWINNRAYIIGQSNFEFEKIKIRGEITTFVSPDSSFNAIVNEIRKANESIYLNIYEFTSPFLCDELIKVLIDGISVKIFLEGSPIGGISDEEKIILKRISNYGGKIRFIVSDNEKKIYARYIFNHGKYLIIDNRTVIVESCNWGKTGVPKNTTYGNREWGIIIKNEKVADYFLKVFFDDWNPNRCDSYSFNDMNFSFPTDFYLNEWVNKGSYKPTFKTKTYVSNFTVIPVFSPDTSYKAINHMIESANECIYIQQLYIYKNWSNTINPFVEKLIKKAKQGVNIKVILNFNPSYESTNLKSKRAKKYLLNNGIEVKFIYTNWSIFTNIHNKGVIVDNKSVSISSINWNQNSFTRNREAGVIVECEEIAKYYSEVFFYDWKINSPVVQKKEIEIIPPTNYKNSIYIVVIFTMTFALIARDWRKRQWT